ncbi:MAG: nucleotidyltransferase family protein [Rhizobiaceae bacterium]
MSDDSRIDQAMVLAAGLGTRMRPITETIPKPLIEVAGKTLLDHALDALVDARVNRAIVNVHYLPEQIETHVARRKRPSIDISDERKDLLDSGGGVKHARQYLHCGGLIILNADSFWVDDDKANVDAMQDVWDPGRMDMLLLVADKKDAVGFDGAGDFSMDNEGRLTRRGEAAEARFVYAGAIICETRLFDAVNKTKFSLNRLFDEAIAAGRLFGHVLDGLWLHVGTPAAIGEAETAISEFRRGRD